MDPPTNAEHTAAFYGDYWPRNVPNLAATRDYMRGVVAGQRWGIALDAGCGTGVCSVALADHVARVLATDFSPGALRIARQLAREGGAPVSAINADLLRLPLASESVDLVWCWGVIHHTRDPVRALDELVRVLRPGGTLVLAVYLRTWLTPFHEAVRWLLVRSPRLVRPLLLGLLTAAISALAGFASGRKSRQDDERLAAEVEDWYFVPEKHFFSIDEMGTLLQQRGLSYEVVDAATGRFRSSSNFVVRAVKSGQT